MRNKTKRLLEDSFHEACRALNVNYLNIDFVYERVGKRFSTKYNSAELGDNSIFINEDWVELCESNNESYDLKFVMYHEARHLYQRMILKDFNGSKKLNLESPMTIALWQMNANNYIRNIGDSSSQIKNAQQAVEIDANAFALAMMRHKGVTEMRYPQGLENIIISRAKEIMIQLKWLKSK